MLSPIYKVVIITVFILHLLTLGVECWLVWAEVKMEWLVEGGEVVRQVEHQHDISCNRPWQWGVSTGSEPHWLWPAPGHLHLTHPPPPSALSMTETTRRNLALSYVVWLCLVCLYSSPVCEGNKGLCDLLSYNNLISLLWYVFVAFLSATLTLLLSGVGHSWHRLQQGCLLD